MSAPLHLAIAAALVAALAEVMNRFALVSPSQSFLLLIVQLSMGLLIWLSLLVCSVQFVWRTWLNWSVRVSPAPAPLETLGEITSVFLDPVRGLVMNVADGTQRMSVLVNPQYWHLLPSSALTRKDGKECAVPESHVWNVAKGAEPASLVFITNGTQVIGMGARVAYGRSSYLLTASHVWTGLSPERHLAKGDIQASVSKDSPIFRGCHNPKMDFVLVEIPDKVWAKLQVKAAKLHEFDRSATVSCYGGTDPRKPLVSSATARQGEYIYRIVHGCSTARGWSGTPLYSGNAIVGIHTGVDEIGESNRGVAVMSVLKPFELLRLETIFSEYSNHFIDEDEAKNRDYDFQEFEVIGAGRIAMGKGEYYVPEQDLANMRAFEAKKRSTNQKLWHEYDEDEDYFDAAETLESHLNGRGAVSQECSPPSLISAIIDGLPKSPAPSEECPSISLEDRLCSLEKLMENCLQTLSTLQLKSSQNSESLDGQKEAPKQSSARSGCKQLGTGKQTAPPTSRRRVPVSKPGTPVPSPSDVCEGKSGTPGRSPKRSRRRARGKSTQKLPPAFPSQS